MRCYETQRPCIFATLDKMTIRQIVLSLKLAGACQKLLRFSLIVKWKVGTACQKKSTSLKKKSSFGRDLRMQLPQTFRGTCERSLQSPSQMICTLGMQMDT